MKIFQTYEQVQGMQECMKRPIVFYARQMQEEFCVISLDGDYIPGKPGDYLMRGVEGELHICAKETFEKSYGWVDVHEIEG